MKERVHALENKNTDTNTNAKKLNAWADLMLRFLSVFIIAEHVQYSTSYVLNDTLYNGSIR